MIEELRIHNLGVVEESLLQVPEGSIAITGETGAGKTMIITAIELLSGGRATPQMVRTGADEASVQARFTVDDSELVVSRVIPVSGRSRAYINGALATVSELRETVGPLVDLHGQHDHQSLMRPGAQREALDTFGSIDTSGFVQATHERRRIEQAIAALGGDETERAREIDLLSYQLDELVDAALQNPAEDDALSQLESRLASAFDDRAIAAKALALLSDDGEADAAIVKAAAHLTSGSDLFAELSERILVLQEELVSISSEVRYLSESIVDDPEAREQTRARRQLLAEIRRKYGPTLDDAIAYRDELGARLESLRSHDAEVAKLEHDLQAATEEQAAQAAQLDTQRREFATTLATAVEQQLMALAMPNARVEISVDGFAGADVSILLAPNPGQPLLPLTKAASGGELSRTVLALRLVSADGPPINVFDEVDAGIGGEAAREIGVALSGLANSGQVFVVTHLAQVAARTDHQLLVEKDIGIEGTASRSRFLTNDERIGELARMLSGAADSPSAKVHAEELLADSEATTIQKVG